MRIWRFVDNLIFKIMAWIFGVFNKDYQMQEHYNFMQFIKFGLVGVSNAVVYYIVYTGSLILFRINGAFPVWDYQISQVLGFVVSVFWAFCLNRTLVFKENTVRFWTALIKFYITYSFTGLFMNSLLLYFWKCVGISEFIAPLINVLFTTPINFILNKMWAFKRQD